MSIDWRSYPFQLVPGDGRLEFPAAEGEHPDHESDTWFIAGQLGAATGRSFAFLAIVNKNRPGGSIVADFYTMALFDLDTGAYGTYTDYDMPPANLIKGAARKLSTAEGHLDIRYDSDAGTATWTACRNSDAQLLPCTYRVSLVGTDQAGQAMSLELDVTPTRAPVPVGAANYNGKITCFGQADTYSYFQTGMAMTGTLRWGEMCEQVAGSAGHVDRQWFPKYAGGGGTGGDPRARSHEWRTISLDNGVDLSIWRQFDRTKHNALQPFSGVTASYPESPPECAEDVEVTVSSYVRWPDSVRPLLPPLSPTRFMPDRHRLTSATMQLDLIGEPLVPVPAHALPIEYMEGPYRYHGTLQGQPVSGFGFYERSLALYRDWELLDVLAAAVAELKPAEPELFTLVDRIRPLVSTRRRSEARELAQAAAAALPADRAAGCDDALASVIEALAAGG
ncbi:MAG: secreted hydrolase [Mycobacterium sp.]|nr:secreted hydrolase [Mycobacterium sp.]